VSVSEFFIIFLNIKKIVTCQTDVVPCDNGNMM